MEKKEKKGKKEQGGFKRSSELQELFDAGDLELVFGDGRTLQLTASMLRLASPVLRDALSADKMSKGLDDTQQRLNVRLSQQSQFTHILLRQCSTCHKRMRTSRRTGRSTRCMLCMLPTQQPPRFHPVFILFSACVQCTPLLPPIAMPLMPPLPGGWRLL